MPNPDVENSITLRWHERDLDLSPLMPQMEDFIRRVAEMARGVPLWKTIYVAYFENDDRTAEITMFVEDDDEQA